uniref:Uncharacterized protein n=1 Tax=Davidia involucrata TaxID=16924 RepID=A0A5B6YS84_DAVIN
MNDVLASECSSGCESGWTLYLEHSVLSSYISHRGNEFVDERGVFAEEKRAKYEDEEENLSMVSDASSGPPHFNEDELDYDSGCFYHAPIDATMPKNSGKKEKIKEHRHQKVQEQSSFLDDTASSPIFNFSNNNYRPTSNQASMDNILDFEGRSAFHGQFGFYQSSLSGNQLQQNQWFGGKRQG